MVFDRPSALVHLRNTISTMRPLQCGHELIRIGGNGDGGYLVPDDLDGIVACFSPGVDRIAQFELTLAQRYGIPCFLADASVAEAPERHPIIHFERRFLGSQPDDKYMTLDDWVTRKEDRFGSGDLILQMDIEGAEYDVLTHASDEMLNRFRVIVLELHGLERLFLNGFRLFFDSMIRKLLKNHAVVHLHPNNCCGKTSWGGVEIPRVMELTLLRNDRVFATGYREDFPHPLDDDNTRNPTLPLPPMWYGPADAG